MAHKEYKIFLKTLADLSGASKVGRWLTKHSRAVRNLIRTYKVLRTTGSAALRALKSAWGGATKAIRMGSGAIIGATAALGAVTISAAKFNTQMARAWTMAGGGIGQFRKMRKEVRELSGDLGIAKDELANGLYQALSAGVPEDNAITFLATAAKVAVADGSDVATAVDGITTVLNSYKISADKSEEVTDLLFSTVANGKTTFGELATSLSTAAPAAAALGVPLEQLLAATASITKQGTPTAQAMTQIRAALTGLSKELGDGWSKSMSFQDALQLVYDRAGGSNTKLLKMLGTTEAVAAVLQTAGRSAQAANADLGAMANSAGALKNAFDKVNQFRHWQRLSQTIKSNMTRIGTVIDKVIRPVVDAVTNSLDKWDDNDAFFQQLEQSLTRIRNTVIGLYQTIKNGDLQKVWLALKDILVGAIRVAVEKAGKWLLKIAPIIGEKIGKGFLRITGDLLGWGKTGRASAAGKAAKAGDISKTAGLIYSVSFGLIGSKKTKEAVRKHQKRMRQEEDELNAEDVAKLGGAEQFKAGKQALQALADSGFRMYQQYLADHATEQTPTTPAKSSSPVATSTVYPATHPSEDEVQMPIEGIRDQIGMTKEEIQIYKDRIADAQSTYNKEKAEAAQAAAAVNAFPGSTRFNPRSFSYRQKLAALKKAAAKEEADAQQALQELQNTKSSLGGLISDMVTELKTINAELDKAKGQIKSARTI